MNYRFVVSDEMRTYVVKLDRAQALEEAQKIAEQEMANMDVETWLGEWVQVSPTRWERLYEGREGTSRWDGAYVVEAELEGTNE